MNVTLLIWVQLTLILGISGNVFVLYATIIHNAIKLDKMSIWIIKNLAVVDICNCIFIVVPAIANQYSEGTWVFGSDLCYAHAINFYSFVVANVFLINIFSINKLMRCKYPLRNFNCSRRQKILVSLSTVIFSLSLMIWQMVAISKIKLYVLIEEDMMTPLRTCHAGIPQTSNNPGIIIALIVALLYDGVPCLTLVISTATLLIYAIKKTNRPINKLNVLMVILVTTCFLVSFQPVMIHSIAHFYSSISKDRLDDLFEWAWSLTFLSSWINPIIYLTTNQSFRDFTKTHTFFSS